MSCVDAYYIISCNVYMYMCVLWVNNNVHGTHYMEILTYCNLITNTQIPV